MPGSLQVLPPPGVWITSLSVMSNTPRGPAWILYSDAAFTCRPATPPCRASPSALPEQAAPVLVNSGWQLVAVLKQLSLEAAGDTTKCPAPRQYTIHLAGDVSLLPLKDLLSTRSNPVDPYYITANVTLQPQPGLTSAVLDLAEVRQTALHHPSFRPPVNARTSAVYSHVACRT